MIPSGVYDSNFFVATFDTESCPEQLKLVTHIVTSDTDIFLHYFRHLQRVPCFTCYSPYHSSARCGGRNKYIIMASSPVFSLLLLTSVD